MKFIIVLVILYIIENINNLTLDSRLMSKTLSFSQLYAFNEENLSVNNNDKNHQSHKVFVVHQGNKLLHEGKSIKFKIEFDKEGNLLLRNKQGVKKIPLNELLFMNENIIFKIEEVEKIEANNYKDFLYKNFVLGLHDLVTKDKNINKYGLIIFHHKKEDVNGIIVEKDLAVVFGPTEDEVKDGLAETKMKNLKDKFVNKYHSAMNDWNNLNINIPDKLSKADYYFVYWNSLDHFKETVSYYVELADEGVVLNQIQNKTMSTVKIAFRYDQLFDCEGTKEISAQVTPAIIRKGLPIQSCCIGYNINWHDSHAKELFCSTSKTSKSCENEINIFRKFVYKKCIDAGVNRLGRLFERKESFDVMSINIRIQFKYLLESLKRFNIWIKVFRNHYLIRYFIMIRQNFEQIYRSISMSLNGVNVNSILGRKNSGKIINSHMVSITSENNTNKNSNINSNNRNRINSNNNINSVSGVSKLHRNNGNTNNQENNINSQSLSSSSSSGSVIGGETQTITTGDQSSSSSQVIGGETQTITTIVDQSGGVSDNQESSQITINQLRGEMLKNTGLTSNEESSSSSVSTINEMSSSSSSSSGPIIINSSDPDAYLKIAESQRLEASSNNKIDLESASNTVDLSRRVSQVIEKSLGRSLSTKESLTLITLVNDARLSKMFIEMIDRGIRIPFEVISKFNQLRFEGALDELKRAMKNSQFQVYKDNNKRIVQCEVNNKTKSNITFNQTIVVVNETKIDVTPTLPIDEPSLYQSDDELFHTLGKDYNKPDALELRRDENIVIIDKNKHINIPNDIKRKPLPKVKNYTKIEVEEIEQPKPVNQTSNFNNSLYYGPSSPNDMNDKAKVRNFMMEKGQNTFPELRNKSLQLNQNDDDEGEKKRDQNNTNINNKTDLDEINNNNQTTRTDVSEERRDENNNNRNRTEINEEKIDEINNNNQTNRIDISEEIRDENNNRTETNEEKIDFQQPSGNNSTEVDI